MDDTAVDYGLVSLFFTAEDDEAPPAPGDDGGTGTPSGSPAVSFGTNLWIELLQVTNSQAFLRLHNTVSNQLYQLQSKTNLTPGEMFWVPGQIVLATNTNVDFLPVSATPPNQFFRGEFGTNVVFVTAQADAIRPGPFVTDGSEGSFTIDASNSPSGTVFYHMGGSAIEGQDYTSLSGSVTLSSSGAPRVFVSPLADTNTEFDEDVIMSLTPTNTYLVAPDQASAIISLFDDVSTNGFLQLAVTNVDTPSGAGYDPTHNCLVVSIGTVHNGPNGNFMQISSNGSLANWTTIANMSNEIKLTIVEKTTNGFTNGDMFFSNGQHGGIGWLSADGTRSNLNWLSLTNIVPSETDVQGGLYVDQTGIFSNDLVAVTGDAGEFAGGGVYLITAGASAMRLANITNTHLEGVVTLPNDPAKYGPWAAKIITGAEELNPPLIFAIDPNGAVTSFDLGIQPEDFHIIPTNQDFYLDDLDSSQILKLPRTLLNNYWGDVIITQGGEVNPNSPAKLFIIHWDGTNFLRHLISDPDGNTDFEHGTFAPIDIPATNLFNSNGH